MYNWIDILYPVYILIIAYCHCLMSVFIHCRALRAFTHVCISTESFQESYPDPLNKYISTTIHSAFISVHHHRPSAQAAPMLGVVINLQQKSGTQCGAYGWWLPSQKHINIKQQHVSQLMANLKVIQKLPSFDKKTAVNVWLSSSSQQTNFGSVWHHHKVQYRWNHMLKGSAHTTLGDARCGDEDQDQFLKKLDDPDGGGMSSFLPKKSGHLQISVTNHAGSREVLTLCSGQFVVPGAHDIDWVLGAPNFVQSARSTELFKSAWDTLVLKCHMSRSLDPARSDHFYFFHFFAPLTHSRSELGHHNFL